MVGEIVGTIVGGIFSGGATGLIGVLIQRYFDYQHRNQDIETLKLNHANSIQLATIESESAKRRAEADEAIASSNKDAAIGVAEADADAKMFSASFENDTAKYLAPESQKRPGFAGAAVVLMMGIVDFVRGILRPGMTIYLCILVTMMFLWVKDLSSKYGVYMTADQAMQIQLQIISTITYVFTTCSTWWFGSRPPKKQ